MCNMLRFSVFTTKTCARISRCKQLRNGHSSHILRHSFKVASCSVTAPQLHFHREFSSETLKHYYSPEFLPVGYAQTFLEFVHDMSGLPWWASILIATMTIRTVFTLPISVYSQRNTAKLVNLGPELKQKGEILRADVASAIKQFNWDSKTAHFYYRKNMHRITRELYERDNCHPFKTTLVFWVQMPIWIGMSLALRNMSGASTFKTLPFLESVHPELAQEGVLWFTNMMVPDPLFILPFLCGLSNLLNTELMALTKQDPTRLQRYLTNFFRAIGLIVVPIGMIVPSCIVYYWTCSSVYGLISTLALKSPRVKTFLRMPTLPHESSTPYKDLLEAAKQKYRLRATHKK